VEVDSIPQQSQEKTAQVDGADLVVGILAGLDEHGVMMLREEFRALPGSPRILVLQHNSIGNAAEANSQSRQEDASLSFLAWSAVGPDPLAAPMQSISIACQSLFATTEKLGARSCCFVASEMESATPQWVCGLLQPLVESDFDLVTPYYTPRMFQGLLNSSIVYPLTRCLYGKRIHNPFGPDVGVSRRLAQKILGTNRNNNGGSSPSLPLASLAPIAACENLQICQVHVGARVYPPTDWTNMSSLIAQVLGPIFLEMERSAACWQRTRGSVAVPVNGECQPPSQESGTLDLNRMVETFRLGVRDLQEIWSLVLPPATLFELRKLSRSAPEQVHMPDELWARIVYDFALAHRLRTINRDHLLRSMTPLYLAWVVSYARELETAGAASVEQRIERLSLAYEAAKPYLISRWRWPDRFNP
jgi:glucosylglycerate synthase